MRNIKHNKKNTPPMTDALREKAKKRMKRLRREYNIFKDEDGTKEWLRKEKEATGVDRFAKKKPNNS